MGWCGKLSAWIGRLGPFGFSSQNINEQPDTPFQCIDKLLSMENSNCAFTINSHA